MTLRGFCKECGWSVSFNLKERKTEIQWPDTKLIIAASACRHKAEWFLSAKQMKTIRENKSKELLVWLNTHGGWRFDAEVFEILLNGNPFLVAEILEKEEGK